jgi:hypothetical protein
MDARLRAIRERRALSMSAHDQLYHQRLTEVAVVTQKLAHMRAEIRDGHYSAFFTMALDALDFDVSAEVASFLTNVYTPRNWDRIQNQLDELRTELLAAGADPTYGVPAIPRDVDLDCLPEWQSIPDMPEDDPDEHASGGARLKIRNHQRRHVQDRLAQLLGLEPLAARVIGKNLDAVVAATAGCDSIKDCRLALFAAGFPRLYPYLAYIRSFHGHSRPYVSPSEFRQLVTRTSTMITVSADYRSKQSWAKACDRSYYCAYAALAAAEIVGPQRAAELADYMRAHEAAPPRISIDELRAAVAAAER